MNKFQNLSVILALSILFVIVVLADKAPPEQQASVQDDSLAAAQMAQGSTIGPTDLPQETKQLLSAIETEFVHVFDLRLAEEQPVRATLWLELFEHGEKKENLFHVSMGNLPKEGKQDELRRILFAYDFYQDENQNERLMRLVSAIASTDGYSSGKSYVPMTESFRGRVTSPLSMERPLAIEQPITLITIIESNANGMGVSMSDVEDYDKTGNEALELFQQNGRVMLYRMKLERAE